MNKTSIIPVNETPNGRLSFCKCCDNYQLEFGNILFTFSQDQLSGLTEYIREIDGETYTRKNDHTPHNRKIFLQFPVKGILFCLNKEELEELKELLFIYPKKEQTLYEQLTKDGISLN